MVVGPGLISNSRTFGRSFGVSQMLFFSGIESSTGFPNIAPRTIFTGTMSVCDSIEGRNFRAGNCCCRVVLNSFLLWKWWPVFFIAFFETVLGRDHYFRESLTTFYFWGIALSDGIMRLCALWIIRMSGHFVRWHLRCSDITTLVTKWRMSF